MKGFVVGDRVTVAKRGKKPLHGTIHKAGTGKATGYWGFKAQMFNPQLMFNRITNVHVKLNKL